MSSASIRKRKRKLYPHTFSGLGSDLFFSFADVCEWACHENCVISVNTRAVRIPVFSSCHVFFLNRQRRDGQAHRTGQGEIHVCTIRVAGNTKMLSYSTAFGSITRYNKIQYTRGVFAECKKNHIRNLL